MGLFSRTGGLPPKDRHPNRQEYRLQDMRGRAALAGLPINLKPAHWPTNCALSGYAIIAAQNAGGGDLGKLVHSFGAACWAEDRNISQDDVIKDCLHGAGFNPTLADSGLLTGADTFSSNLEETVRRGVFEEPFFITDQDERLWGQDRLDDLDAVLAGKV